MLEHEIVGEWDIEERGVLLIGRVCHDDEDGKGGARESEKSKLKPFALSCGFGCGDIESTEQK